MAQRSRSVEDYAAVDWAEDFRRQALARLSVPVVTPRAVLQRAFERLLRELESPCLLAVVVRYLLEDDSFVHVVGPSERLLTPGVVNTAVQALGGYDQPWEALYYQRFAQTEREAEFFVKWLELLQDARTAPPGTAAVVGEEQFASWTAVAELARARLQQAVGRIRGRFQEGPQVEREWEVVPLPAGAGSALVQRVKRAQGGS